MENHFNLKKVLWLILLLLLISGLSLTVIAQTETLTLNKAVELALKADYTIKIDTNSFEKSKLAVKKAALDIFPTATVEGHYQYQTSDHTYPNSYQIVIQESIPTPFNLYGRKIETAIETAMWDQVIAEATRQIDAAEVIYDTYNYYLTVLKDQQLLEQYEKAVAQYKAANELANTQLSLGTITKPDQLKVENYLNQAEYNLEKGRSDLKIARQILANQIGMTDLSGYQLENAVPDAVVPEQDLEALKQQALQRRLELRKDEMNIKIARRTLAGAKNEQLPTVSLSYNDRKSTNYFGISYEFLSGELTWLGAYQGGSDVPPQRDILNSSSTSYFGNDNKYYTLKLSLGLDLGSKANTVKQAQYTLVNTQLALGKDRDNIALEVEQAAADYEFAVKKYELDQKSLAYYQKDLEIKGLQVKLHAITYSDYYTAMQEELTARITAVKSKYDYYLALQKLKKVTGDLYLFNQQTVLEEK